MALWILQNIDDPWALLLGAVVFGIVVALVRNALGYHNRRHPQVVRIAAPTWNWEQGCSALLFLAAIILFLFGPQILW